MSITENFDAVDRRIAYRGRSIIIIILPICWIKIHSACGNNILTDEIDGRNGNAARRISHREHGPQVDHIVSNGEATNHIDRALARNTLQLARGDQSLELSQSDGNVGIDHELERITSRRRCDACTDNIDRAIGHLEDIGAGVDGGAPGPEVQRAKQRNLVRTACRPKVENHAVIITTGVDVDAQAGDDRQFLDVATVSVESNRERTVASTSHGRHFSIKCICGVKGSINGSSFICNPIKKHNLAEVDGPVEATDDDFVWIARNGDGLLFRDRRVIANRYEGLGLVHVVLRHTTHINPHRIHGLAAHDGERLCLCGRNDHLGGCRQIQGIGNCRRRTKIQRHIVQRDTVEEHRSDIAGNDQRSAVEDRADRVAGTDGERVTRAERHAADLGDVGSHGSQLGSAHANAIHRYRIGHSCTQQLANQHCSVGRQTSVGQRQVLEAVNLGGGRAHAHCCKLQRVHAAGVDSDFRVVGNGIHKQICDVDAAQLIGDGEGAGDEGTTARDGCGTLCHCCKLRQGHEGCIDQRFSECSTAHERQDLVLRGQVIDRKIDPKCLGG